MRIQENNIFVDRNLQRSEYPVDTYLIQPQSGIRIDVIKDKKIEIIDVEGGQVADFFAGIKETHR